jgi:hypothetical protein
VGEVLGALSRHQHESARALLLSAIEDFPEDNDTPANRQLMLILDAVIALKTGRNNERESARSNVNAGS